MIVEWHCDETFGFLSRKTLQFPTCLWLLGPAQNQKVHCSTVQYSTVQYCTVRNVA